MERFTSFLRKVDWERIYLLAEIEAEIELSEPFHVYLVNGDEISECEFEILRAEGHIADLRLNVTNSGINRCVNNGTYIILLRCGDRYSVASYEGTSEELASWGRSFRYNSNAGAYTVTFLLDEYSEEATVNILVYNTVRRKMSIPDAVIHGEEALPEPVSQARGESRLKKTVLRPFRWIRNTARRVLRRQKSSIRKHAYWKARKKAAGHAKPVILFLSEQDDKLALNMEALYDRMVERGLDQDHTIRFSLRKKTSEPQTWRSDLETLRKMGDADILIVDDHVPYMNDLQLSPDTEVIQIWHAGAGFKGVGYSRWGHSGCPGPFSAHRQYTWCISGSSNISRFFSEQFGILDEQVVPTGMPRMDRYLNEEHRRETTEKLYGDYPFLKDRFVILFAPTYRGRDRENAYYPYERIDFDALYDLCVRKDAVVVFKMHPWVAAGVPIRPEHADRFVDLGTYKDINDLFYVTDLLITDYSSSIYEFSLMRKPMLFYAYDKVQYSVSRGFHRKYDDTIPGKLCESFEEVLAALENEDFEYEKVEKYVRDHFDFVDDHSCDRLIDWLILGQIPREYTDALEAKRQKVAAARGIDFSALLGEGIEEEETDETGLDL